jgi:toxin ParE1/3/4
MKLIISRAAAADLERLRLFLAGKNSDAAQRAIAELVEAIGSITAFPDRPSSASGLRDLIVPFGRSAYVVRFEHDSEQQRIIIVRVWHGREART